MKRCATSTTLYVSSSSSPDVPGLARLGGCRESGFGQVNDADAIDGHPQTKGVWTEVSDEVQDPFVMKS